MITKQNCKIYSIAIIFTLNCTQTDRNNNAFDNVGSSKPAVAASDTCLFPSDTSRFSIFGTKTRKSLLLRKSNIVYFASYYYCRRTDRECDYEYWVFSLSNILLT